MSGLPFYRQTLVASVASGALFNTYTTTKTVINATDLFTIPPGVMRVGSMFEVHVQGGLSNIVTTPGTVTFQCMMGSIVAFTSGAIQLNATAHTLLPFDLRVKLRVDSIGSGTSAKFLAQGILNGIMFTNTAAQTDAANTTGEFPVPATAPAVGTGFDSTIANIWDFWTGFSISNAGNGVQVYNYSLEQLQG